MSEEKIAAPKLSYMALCAKSYMPAIRYERMFVVFFGNKAVATTDINEYKMLVTDPRATHHNRILIPNN